MGDGVGVAESIGDGVGVAESIGVGVADSDREGVGVAHSDCVGFDRAIAVAVPADVSEAGLHGFALVTVYKLV